MGRGKIDIRRIENSSSRQVTFSKRRVGLAKKAQELSILCDAEVGLIIFSSAGKKFEFASSSMTKVIERYMRCAEEETQVLDHHNKDDHDQWHQEIRSLMKQVETSQSTYKHMIGEDILNLNLQELHHLEQKLDMGLSRVRSRKDYVLLERMEELNRKGKQLDVENKDLKNKIMGIQKLLEMAIPQQTSPPLDVVPFLVQPSQPNLHTSPNNPITSLQLFKT